MGRYEVTQAEYEAVLGFNPSWFTGPSIPVEGVSWISDRLDCKGLTAQHAANLPRGYVYRLPTDAEWEDACRAGTTSNFHYGAILACGDARFGLQSCGQNPNGGPVTVGSYVPNAFGVYDTHGNVMEWCLDSYAPYTAAPVTDPFVTGGTDRVLRGGSWASAASSCRPAHRGFVDPSVYTDSFGFRIVLAPARVP